MASVRNAGGRARWRRRRASKGRPAADRIAGFDGLGTAVGAADTLVILPAMAGGAR